MHFFFTVLLYNNNTNKDVSSLKMTVLFRKAVAERYKVSYNHTPNWDTKALLNRLSVKTSLIVL